MRGGGRLWRLTRADERGTALIMGLVLVMVMTLLGVALFEMSTIEAVLARSDVSDMQAFYCAEAEAARIYNLYAPGNDPLGMLGSQTFAATALALANGTYVFNGSAAIDAGLGVVTITATCTLPNGRSRTVQRKGTRQYLNPGYQYAVVSGGFNPATGAQEFLGDFSLAGDGVPVRVGGPYAGGADSIKGDVYVSGNVYVRGQASVTGYSASDSQPTVTVYPGRTVASASSGFDPSAPGAVGQASLNPMPVLSNDQGSGVIDRIRQVVDPPGSVPAMTGTYNGSPVYNLSEIFRQLGTSNEGNIERNLCRPGTSCSPNLPEPLCTFGVASTEPRCRIWQDLVIIGPKETCNPTCQADVQGPADKPSYYFMGLPRGPSTSPQQTGFDTIYAAAVNTSAELRQLGFTTRYSSLGARLDALLGTNPDGEGRVTRLVDLTVGTDPTTGQSILRPQPPIFYVDGYWRTDRGMAGFAYNGRGTVVATKSMIVSDNLLYLGSLSNVNTALPASSVCPTGTADRTNCGLADMLGLIARDDIWMGDSNGTVHEISAVMLAGRDFNFFEYTSSGSCCNGPSNPVTFNGTVMATRQAALVRDWADPSAGHESAQCNMAQSPCRPVVFFPSDTSCGASGCWKFMAMDPTTGFLSMDSSRPAFRDGCVTVSSSPLTPSACPPGSRRVTHFQLNVNYDARLRTAPELTPPGLPAGGAMIYKTLLAGSWKDCGGNPSCP